MRHQKPPDTEEVEKLLAVLANQRCRTIVGYLRDTSGDVATLDELASHVRHQNTEANPGQNHPVTVWLHHVTLPRLADAGLVDYDARSHTVRYRSHPLLDTLIEDGIPC